MKLTSKAMAFFLLFVPVDHAFAWCSISDCPDVKSGWGCRPAGSKQYNAPFPIKLQTYICVTSGMADLVGVVKLVESSHSNVRARIDVDDCSYTLERQNYQQERLSSGGFQITLELNEYDTYIISPQLTDGEEYSFRTSVINLGNPVCTVGGGEIISPF